MTMHSRYQQWILFFVFLCAGIIFGLITFVNHYNFRSYALDLGIFNNALYDFAHFKSNEATLLYPDHYFFLQTHFSLFPVIVSPLYWIFGSYTLLVLQWAAVLFGGWGIYKFMSLFTENFFIRLCAVIHFFSLWGIYSALAFDYHDNVVGTMFVPWLFFYFKQEKWKAVFLFTLLLLISKENMALWGIFIFAGLAFLYRKEKQKRTAALFYSLGSLLYFMLVIFYFIPAFSPFSEAYTQFRMYTAFGESSAEIIKNIFTHPLMVLSMLFENQLGLSYYDGIKEELHKMVIFSGGFIFLLRPQYFIMLIPLYLQKLLSDDPVRWGISCQYSIEFAPVITCALFHFIASTREKLWVYLFIGGFIFLSAGYNIGSIMHRTALYHWPEQFKIFSKEHYENHFDVPEAHRALNQIPANAVVSAQSMLAPHLACRDKIYQYPYTGDAQYIVLLENDNPFPLDEKDYKTKLEEMKNNSSWEMISQAPLIIFRKKQ